MPEEEKNAQQEENQAQETEAQQDAAPEAEESNLPDFQFAAEDTGTLKKKVTVTVPRERIDAKTDEMYGELGQSAQIPGFRVGRAPRRLIEKRFGGEVSTDVRNSVVGEAVGDTLENADFRTLGEPDINLEDIEIPDSGDLKFDFEVEIAPDVELPELEGIEVEKKKLEVTEERIEEYLEQILESQAKYEDTEDPADDGDMVIADVKLQIEGVEEPVTAEDQTLRVAPGQVEGIPMTDLGKELKGKKAGDKVELTIDKIPESHPAEEWREKKVDVEIELKNVRKRELPELNDEQAKKMGFDSLDELRDFVKNRMEQQIEQETKQDMRRQVEDYLLEKVDIELPEGVATRHAAATLQRQYINMLQQGVPREKLEENMTEIKAGADEQSKRDLKLQFIIGKIAEEKEIDVSEGEINSRIAQMAGMYGRRPERVRQELEQDGTLAQMQSSLLEEKVVDKLLEDAKVKEVQAEEKSE